MWFQWLMNSCLIHMFAIYSLHFGSLAPCSVCFFIRYATSPSTDQTKWTRKKRRERRREKRMSSRLPKREEKEKPAEAAQQTRQMGIAYQSLESRKYIVCQIEWVPDVKYARIYVFWPRSMCVRMSASTHSLRARITFDIPQYFSFSPQSRNSMKRSTLFKGQWNERAKSVTYVFAKWIQHMPMFNAELRKRKKNTIFATQTTCHWTLFHQFGCVCPKVSFVGVVLHKTIMLHIAIYAASSVWHGAWGMAYNENSNKNGSNCSVEWPINRRKERK